MEKLLLRGFSTSLLLIFTNFLIFAQDSTTFILDTIPIDANMRIKFENDYEIISAFKFSHHFLNSELKENKTVSFGLKFGEQQVTFDLQEDEIRSADYVEIYGNEDGTLHYGQGEMLCNTYKGIMNGVENNKVAAYISNTSFHFMCLTENGTYYLLNTNNNQEDEKTCVWAKMKPKRGIDCTANIEAGGLAKNSDGDSRSIPCIPASISTTDRNLLNTLFVECAIEVEAIGLNPADLFTLTANLKKDFEAIKTIYGSDFGLKLVLSKIYIQTASTQSAFLPNCERPDFVFHSDGGSGHANLGICRASTSVARGGFSILTFSHELGHVLGAFQHDCTCDGIMAGGGGTNCTNLFLNNGRLEFSTHSRNQITSFLRFNHACLINNPGVFIPTNEFIQGPSVICTGSFLNEYSIVLPLPYTLQFPNPPNTYKEPQLVGGTGLTLTYIGAISQQPNINSIYPGPYRVKASNTSQDTKLWFKAKDCSNATLTFEKNIRIGIPRTNIDISIAKLYVGGTKNPWRYRISVINKPFDVDYFEYTIKIFSSITGQLIRTVNGKSTSTSLYSTFSSNIYKFEVTVVPVNGCGTGNPTIKYGLVLPDGGIKVKNNEFSRSKSFNCYPNPAQTELNVNWSSLDFDNSKPIILEITDMLGAKVVRYELSNKQEVFNLDINDFDKGIYFISLKQEGKTSTILSQKFIKN